ncbi:hypothetical protein TUM4438_11820 [Shewanella sairae]|uniref:Uncharacterized protein n=1 Tax=Shewanella sairae TaxID=190310 RepID=A0ABQ4P6X1_9GAMM|nr:hypothetical protein [Shewanella sairae]MCL1129361.1 hypothetical protein [Shewanella sairae]GIU43279.1 hypothetical protein TUM4438_11820 [Shewanella sairae]
MRILLWFAAMCVAVSLLLLSLKTQATAKSLTQTTVMTPATNSANATDSNKPDNKTPMTTITLNKYLGGTEGKLNNKSALNFKFTNANGSNKNTCSIITTDNYLRHSKNRLENINLSEKNFYFDCTWDGRYYFLSNRVRTYAEVIIKQPDSQFPMSMHIEAKLVSLTGEQVEIISGDISLRRNPR